MISVCLASYNGEKYIKEQITSILCQLGEKDELIVSDDGSTDKTVEIICSMEDPRIRILANNAHNLIHNFEYCLSLAKGDYIFLSDQDDIWESNKVRICVEHLGRYDLVVSNCSVVDQNLKLISERFFSQRKVSMSIMKNIISNHYLGCCMAFRKKILEVILPFPSKIAMHDIWIGLCAQAFFQTKFIPMNLVKYRRHGDNNSPTGGKSTASLFYKINYRLYFLFALISRIIKIKSNNKVEIS